MALPTVTVTVRFNDQSGAPVPGATVVAKLTTTERYGGYVVPKEYRGETDIGGVALIDVFPNELGSEGSEYQFQIRDNRTGKSVKVFAVVPNADCELHNIAELEPYDMRGTGQVITTEIAGYAAAASSSAATAATSATSAATSATAAEAARTAAEAAKEDAAAIAGVNINLDALSAAVTNATAAKTAAEAARDQSVVYRDSANTYSQTATAKAVEAATSATSAATQASNAANSANTATTKANDAATSATSAATSATAAGAARTAAEAAKEDAETALAGVNINLDALSAAVTNATAEKTAAEAARDQSVVYRDSAYNEANRAKAEADRAANIAVGSIPDATESTKGIAEIATALETSTGTDDFRIVTPLKLKGLLDTRVVQANESTLGMVRLADATEATAGTDGTKALSPLRAKALLDLKAPLASPTFTGTPAAPTASVGTATTQIATTAFVAAATPAATDTTAGKVELATNAEAQTGSDAARAVTPAALKSVLTAVATEYTGLLGNIDEKYQDLGTVSGATGINLSSGNVLSATISAATTFSFTGATSAKSRTFLLILTNGGAYAVTWPSSVMWAGGTAPILTTAGVDMVFFNSVDGGTTWRAAIKDFK